jgi:hypothetical protein
MLFLINFLWTWNIWTIYNLFGIVYICLKFRINFQSNIIFISIWRNVFYNCFFKILIALNLCIKILLVLYILEFSLLI